ncbi:beta-glucosidase [Chitiniphilus shinanonensis]|uniref:Beta-glucosidase n=1 Tax=Chitiniphilus shinanonensis TaxID=553088 RepID=A0ABQ6BTP9_9NEIS|nr:glycoside hydrolase family 3 protein [Chitiniphilus shinanonensis]GLS05378.1 beta-glucosidase [Chitiniphilus shinanonensis]
MNPVPWRLRLCAAALVTLAFAGCVPEEEQPPIPPSPELQDWPTIHSAIPKDPAIEAKVEALLSGMTLAEKVGQMTQVEIAEVTPDEIRQYHIGSVLNGGGSFPGQNKGAAVADWLALADALWTASMDPANPHQIPLMWGTDAVHGHNNVKGATLFPHNIGLGAARDPALMRRIGAVTAREVASTGIDWAFAPTLAVVRDDRWGRTYEGFAENPEVVESYAGKLIEGLQGQLAKDAKANEKVIATAKHFIGDGGTSQGKDQGITVATEQELINLHGRGYYPALNAGAQTVMASFNSWQDKAAGEGAKAYKMHGSKYLLTDVLKTKMGFDGFVVSDWNGNGQLTTGNSDSPRNCSNSDCPQAINAGIDMVMVPYRADWQAFIANTIASVQNGEIPQARIDDAVRRILRVKYRAGLFDKPKPSARLTSQEVGTAEHRAVAREAVAKSLVLLKNNDKLLPLSREAKILVAGKSADSLSNQSGGWSLTWQGTNNTNADFGGGTTLWSAIHAIAPNAVLDASADGALGSPDFDAAIVVIGETPYAEGLGDIGKNKTLELARLRPEDIALIDALKARGVKKIVTVLYSGRPLYANKELNRSDAFVAAWLPGTEGDGMTDVLFRTASGGVNLDFQGKLPYSWPAAPCQTPLNVGDADYAPQFAYGYGLSYGRPAEVAPLPEPSADIGCGVTDGGGVADTPLAIFDRGNQDDWLMKVAAPSLWSGVPVVQATSASTATPNGEITATPVDDRNGSQWGAVKATWHNAEGQLYIQTAVEAEGKNLQGYLNAGGALVFDARLGVAPSSPVKARIDCVYPCIGEIDVTSAIAALPTGTWTELAIPLQCFADKGTDFTVVNTPLLLYSSGTFEIAVGNVRWEPNRAGNVACDGASNAPVTPVNANIDVFVDGNADPALFDDPGSWSYGGGSIALDKTLVVDGEKVLDVVFNGVSDGGGNGGIFFQTRSPNLIDGAVAPDGGVEFEFRVLDYGSNTQGFWVKMVCERKPDFCRTGDLKTALGHPPLNNWVTVRLPFADAGYDPSWNAARLSSVLELLPAWDDQGGTIHFQIRRVKLIHDLP